MTLTRVHAVSEVGHKVLDVRHTRVFPASGMSDYPPLLSLADRIYVGRVDAVEGPNAQTEAPPRQFDRDVKLIAPRRFAREAQPHRHSGWGRQRPRRRPEGRDFGGVAISVATEPRNHAGASGLCGRPRRRAGGGDAIKARALREMPDHLPTPWQQSNSNQTKRVPSQLIESN